MLVCRVKLVNDSLLKGHNGHNQKEDTPMAKQTTIDPMTVVHVANTIANCDFRVSVFRYITGDHSQWTITVGERAWRRHIVLISDGESPMLGILSKAQSDKEASDVDASDVDSQIPLKDLIAGKYSGVCKILR